MTQFQYKMYVIHTDSFLLWYNVPLKCASDNWVTEVKPSCLFVFNPPVLNTQSNFSTHFMSYSHSQWTLLNNSEIVFWCVYLQPPFTKQKTFFFLQKLQCVMSNCQDFVHMAHTHKSCKIITRLTLTAPGLGAKKPHLIQVIKRKEKACIHDVHALHYLHSQGSINRTCAWLFCRSNGNLSTNCTQRSSVDCTSTVLDTSSRHKMLAYQILNSVTYASGSFTLSQPVGIFQRHMTHDLDVQILLFKLI